MGRLTSWIVDHPRLVIFVIGLITASFAVFIPKLHSQVDFKDFLPGDDPAVVAFNRAEDRYGSQVFFMVAIETDDTLFKASTLKKIKEMEEEFEGIVGVKEVQGPINAQLVTGTESAIVVSSAAPNEQVPQTEEEMEAYKRRVMGSRLLKGFIFSEDGKAGAISIKLKPDAINTEVARKVVEITKHYQGSERIYIAGEPYLNATITDLMRRDLGVLLPLVILVVIVVLYFSFRSLRGVLLPLLTVSLSTLWALGSMALFQAPLTPFSFILPVILMAIGIAYGIHVLNRYYEEITKGIPKRDAIIDTIMSMASPVAMAGLTTMAGFLSLISAFLWPQRQLGTFAAVGVLAAMILSLTLIPAILALLPPPGNRKKKNRDKEGGEIQLERGILAGALAGFGVVIARWKTWVLVISAIIFLALLAGTPRIRIETSEREFLGKGSPLNQALDVMDEHFSGSMQMSIEIDTGKRDGLKDPQVLKKIAALQEFLESRRHVKKTRSLADLVREMNQKFHADDPAYYVIPDDRRLIAQLLLMFTLGGGGLGQTALGDFSAGEVIALYDSVGSSEVVALVREVKRYLWENFGDGGSSLKAEMVGMSQLFASLVTKVAQSQVSSLFTSLVACWLIVALLMRSWLAGLISLVPLILTIAMDFGVMAYAGIALDMGTLMVASIALGIGIDYAIHFISRFRLEYAQARASDPNVVEALKKTMRTTGRGIFYNALTLALGFAVLLFSQFKSMAIFGLLIAMTMIVSALSAFTFIPAILIIWRPKFLHKVQMKGSKA